MLFLGMKERPSLDDIADQFMAAEDDRAKQFDSFVKQTELQILQEESPRRSSERNRDEEFSKAQTARRKAFRSCERYRNDLFQKAEAEQDATARSSEEHRMSLFESAQKARKALFDETQAKHIQQNERFVSIAEDLYASGRKKRQDAASKLLEDVLAQFNMFLQDTQDTSFMSHLRRVKIIKPNESVGGIFQLPLLFANGYSSILGTTWRWRHRSSPCCPAIRPRTTDSPIYASSQSMASNDGTGIPHSRRNPKPNPYWLFNS